MQQYPLEKHYWEQSNTERAFSRFEKDVIRLKGELAKNSDKPLTSDNKIKVTTALNLQLQQIGQIGDIDGRLEGFRKRGAKMTERKLRWEKHSSQRLGKNLRLAGKAKPDDKCHAHAIVAGGDPIATGMRGMLAIAGIRVDDAVNGTWLPGYEDDMPHWAMPNAVAHAWLNHEGYHRWLVKDRLGKGLVATTTPSLGKLIVAKLQKTALMLQNERHTIPSEALQTKADTVKRRRNMR